MTFTSQAALCEILINYMYDIMLKESYKMIEGFAPGVKLKLGIPWWRGCGGQRFPRSRRRWQNGNTKERKFERVEGVMA